VRVFPQRSVHVKSAVEDFGRPAGGVTFFARLETNFVVGLERTDWSVARTAGAEDMKAS